MQQTLEPLGLNVVELPEDASTAASAAAALRTSQACIVKSLLFRTGNSHVLVLVSGDRKVRVNLLRHALATDDVKMASRDEVLAITGYEAGGVPPVAHATELSVLIDRHLLGHEVVYAAAGSSRTIFAVRPDQLREMTSGRVADFTT